MSIAFHQEIAQIRQAEMLREAEMSRLAAEYRAAHPRPGLRERLGALSVQLPRLHRPILRAAH
jgi:hypothetical protein